MNKLLAIVSVVAAMAVTARAEDNNAKKSGAESKKRPALTAEQKTIRKELVEKYDTNKNNRLDKEERAKMTPEDLKKWNELTPARPARSEGTEKPKKENKEMKE